MRFGFYINSVARLREGTGKGSPEPALAAGIAETGGADVILAGWSPIGGVLTERDIRLTRELVKGDFYLVIPADARIVDVVVKFRCDGVVLVAAGWDGSRRASPLNPLGDENDLLTLAGAYKSAGMQVSALAAPDISILKILSRAGLSGVVLDCATYAAVRTDTELETELDNLAAAALAAEKLGLVTGAAHNLDYQNVGPIASLRGVEELFIGQAVTARGMFIGLQRAVWEAAMVAKRGASVQ